MKYIYDRNKKKIFSAIQEAAAKLLTPFVFNSSVELLEMKSSPTIVT